MKSIHLALFLLLFLFISQSVSGQSDLRKGKDFALFIAINDYDDWDNLQYPIYESASISKQLVENYGFKTESITNPTLFEINNKLSEYLEKRFDDDSQLFIYFSGHGDFTAKTKEGFFIPKDGKRNDKFQTSYLSFARLEKMVNSIPCPHILLVLDACYSGTFDETIAMRGKPMELPFNEEGPSAWRNFIQDKMEKKSRLLLTSSGKERTPDYSRFAKKLEENLKGNAAGKKILTIDQLSENVKEITPKPHFATFQGHDEGGTFIFFPKGFEKNPAPAIAAEQPKEPVKERQPSKEPVKEPVTPKKSEIETIRSNEYVFILKECKKNGSNIDFYLTLISENQDREIYIYAGSETTIRDEQGSKYEASGLKLGNVFDVNQIHETLVTDLPTPLMVSYRDVQTNPSKIPLLELSIWTNDASYQTLKFRNVPVTY